MHARQQCCGKGECVAVFKHLKSVFDASAKCRATFGTLCRLSWVDLSVQTLSKCFYTPTQSDTHSASIFFGMGSGV